MSNSNDREPLFFFRSQYEGKCKSEWGFCIPNPITWVWDKLVKMYCGLLALFPERKAEEPGGEVKLGKMQHDNPEKNEAMPRSLQA